MEGEGGSEGENNQRRGGTDDNSNENFNGSNSKVANSNEGQSKPKRQMKTPYQLETLEKAYALETYPSEAMRAELSEKLALSDRQLQMWFCHRRLKDKKDLPPKKPPKKAVEKVREPEPEPVPDSPVDDHRLGPELGDEDGSGSGSGSSPFTRSESRSVAPRGYYESQQAALELRAISCVEAQLGGPLREDGPILGIEFDALPPDAFGAPLATIAEQQKRPSHAYDSKVYERHNARPNKAMARAFHEYQFLRNQAGPRSDGFGQYPQHHLHDPMEGPARNTHFAHGTEQLHRSHATQGHSSRVRILPQQDKQGIPHPSPPQDDDVASQKQLHTNVVNTGVNSHSTDYQIVGPENPYNPPGGQVSHITTMQIEKKRKSDDARSAREVEAHEMRIKKELEKQDNLRRKNEERMRKEMERQDRERRKEEERLMRERQREEERLRREQKRELERREKFLLKENLKAEKMRQKEELRKEKEAERRKAALEKATARRIAKESMELIEDEQLELMELAASSKGLSSIIHLDFDTLQNLESFRDSLCVFPPKSVKLRKPFAIQPWINSEENVGNLLMVWKFLITFADILELWPFTLDEFVQAFHDYDSRLLGEIHVALLKVIIKDIADVARTPSTGLGMSQNGAANSGGGHPEIVEGAYAWGFDIRNWHKHLNQLTWPEIFRQLALAAGYGPQLKKRNITWSYANDKDEGRSCEDIISTLRNGSAAEHAVAKMRERGLLAPRKSRHRLTPGTVKFAAFHVLSLEGGEGLTVLELAEKIQKSGLRDLTTSKTPEASISVALTRDAKLFERIAPSTYRVRTAFRKDPADAESILSEARKKIQIFENGFLAGEDADEVEREDDIERDDVERYDDVEREEESESEEVDDDPEVDDLLGPSSANKTSVLCDDFSSIGKESLGHKVELIQDQFEKDLPENGTKDVDGSKDAHLPDAITGQPVITNFEEDNMEIDESKTGESWVEGLAEGEYSDLSVEERLNALVVLVGVANEGNSIRVVLEDRLEAANALKKQMWAEAQIDKIRLRDDNVNKSDFPSINGNKVEPQYTSPAVGGNQSPLLDINIDNNNNNEASPSTAENKKAAVVQNLAMEKPSIGQDYCIGPDNPQTQLSAPYSKRSRSQLKSYISHMAEEMSVYRSLPLGQDRRHNRYWQFVASASCNDPGSGRIFVEYLDGNWRLIDSEEAFDALFNSLDLRGIRESHLRIMLQKIGSSFKENVRKNAQSANIGSRDETNIKNEADEAESSPDCHALSDSPSSTLCGLNSDTSETSSSFKIELGKSESEKKGALRRYQDFQKWMWKECYNSSILSAMKYGKMRCKPQVDICDICLNPYFFEDSHCNCCHRTFPSNNGFNFSKHIFQCGGKLSKDICILDCSLPLRTRLLKALLAFIEASVPSEAFQSTWTEDTRRHWGLKLSKSSSVEELLQLLTVFERAIKRDFLSSSFSTTQELLGSSSMSESAFTDPESVAVLPWVPQTTSAVSLRLSEFDASISYVQLEKSEHRREKETIEYMLPSRSNPFKSSRVVEPADLDHDEFMKVRSAPMKIVQSGNKRGRGNSDKGRGKKIAKRMHDSKQDTGRRSVKVTENLSQRLKQQGRGAQGQSGGRGRRTVRKRRVEKRAVEDLLLGHKAGTHSSNIVREPLRNLDEEWDDDEKASPMTSIHMGAVDNSNSAEEADSDDNAQVAESNDNAQAADSDENAQEVDSDDNPLEVDSDDNAQAVDSDDNGQAVEYDQGNWGIGFNNTPNRWSRDVVGMIDEDVEASDEDNDNNVGLEENEEEESEGDDVMSEEGSDGIADRVLNDDSDSDDSEDSSD
ncbi:homeobox-DDT domain protein RLT1-like isoform X2 [Arachis stenosperma]|uniref:homeobox-DDT domain protein RLT1-like isoform X2 n=1 Tax=Arachis stenosperma TaxID=217475 RepID=UPI0025AD7CE7|nr:homeobox-DDT domain protein RLT1-like isoform X2 [Arachis stenosperma]